MALKAIALWAELAEKNRELAAVEAEIREIEAIALRLGVVMSG